MERWCEPFDKSLTSSRSDDPDTPKHTDSHSDWFLSLIVLLLFLPTCNCLLCQCLFMLSSQLISLTKRKETLESVQFLFNSSPALFIRAQSQALHFQDVQTLRANFLEHWKQVELSHHTPWVIPFSATGYFFSAPQPDSSDSCSFDSAESKHSHEGIHTKRSYTVRLTLINMMWCRGSTFSQLSSLIYIAYIFYLSI